MAALSRMASGQHRKVTIGPKDVVVLSSNPIPGNEKAVAKVINELSEKGANVIFQDAHVSGHACQEELKLIYSLVKPKYAIPIHGEFRHRKANAGLALSLGIPKENVFMLQSGDVLDVALQVDEGTLGIAIEGSDGTPLYQNDDLDTSQFHLEISQTDSYQVTITGSHTKGSIHLKV